MRPSCQHNGGGGKGTRVTQNIGVGIVGYGELGRRQALAWQALSVWGEGAPAARLIAVSAPGEEDAARATGDFGRVTDDFEEVIAHPEVDVVAVCAPPRDRAPILRSALAAGKHTLCAGPLAHDLRDAEEIAALAGRLPGGRQMVSDWRWLPATVRARDIIGEGGIGEPQAFRLTCRRALPLVPGGDGARVAADTLDGLLPHALDLARALNGEIAEVCAMVEAMLDPRLDAPTPTEEAVFALLRFANGSVGVLEAARTEDAAEERCRVDVSGSEGRVSFDGEQPYALTLRGAARVELMPDERPALPPGRLGGEIACLRAFLQSLRDGDTTAPSFRDGLMAQRVTAALCASAEAGAWEAVDLGR